MTSQLVTDLFVIEVDKFSGVRRHQLSVLLRFSRPSAKTNIARALLLQPSRVASGKYLFRNLNRGQPQIYSEELLPSLSQTAVAEAPGFFLHSAWPGVQ